VGYYIEPLPTTLVEPKWKVQFVSYQKKYIKEMNSKAKKPKKTWDVEKDRWMSLGFCKSMKIEEARARGKQLNIQVELLSGRFSNSVMKVMTTKKTGLFPEQKQISLSCSCPDGARMCKHVAATLYGVGTRLDESPELLFKLRKINHMDLITEASAGNSIQSSKGSGDKL
jgi:hypothetical protein